MSEYDGFFINLGRSRERRAEMESQIDRLRLQAIYRRFEASDGNALNFPAPTLKAGETGCFTSHYRLLKENLDNPRPLHVVEDDVLFANCMQEAIRWVIKGGFLDTCDVVYTDTSIPISNIYYRMYKNLFDKMTARDASGRISEVTFNMIDMQDRKFGTTSSFLVNPKSIRKLHDLYAEELAGGARAPIDIYIWQRAMQKVLKVGCLFPFVTSIRLEHSLDTTIAGRYDQLSIFASNVARHSFFVDRDTNKLCEHIEKFLPLPDDIHLQILMRILGFSFTDKFVDF